MISLDMIHTSVNIILMPTLWRGTNSNTWTAKSAMACRNRTNWLNCHVTLNRKVHAPIPARWRHWAREEEYTCI